MNATPSSISSNPFPSEYMNTRVILRPDHANVYNSDEYLSIGYISF